VKAWKDLMISNSMLLSDIFREYVTGTIDQSKITWPHAPQPVELIVNLNAYTMGWGKYNSDVITMKLSEFSCTW
jgi:hypothetical protein